MAKEFEQITLDDIKSYVKRSFHSLMPYRQDVRRGEIVLDLQLSDVVGLRVMTSVHRGSEMAAGRGVDPMRVMLWNLHKRRPLLAKHMPGGKALAVQRTKGWKDTLRRKMEHYIEMYYEKDDYWDWLATKPDGERE